MGEEHTRRHVLQLGTVAVLGGAAGCAGLAADEPSDTGASEPPENETSSDSESDGAEPEQPEPEAPDDGSDDAKTESEDEESDGEEDEAVEDDDAELEEYDIDEPAGVLADVPIPDDPGSYQYPIAGTGEADVRIEFFGGWKCRHTRRFVDDWFDELVDDYVRTGQIDIEYHGVGYRDGTNFHGEDGPRTARAGLATWYSQPDAFWLYFEYLYTNMERADGWATASRLQYLAAEAGVENHEQLPRTVESGAFESQLQETVEAVEEIPIESVPRIVVDDESYSPNADREELHEALEAALGNDDGEADGDEENGE